MNNDATKNKAKKTIDLTASGKSNSKKRKRAEVDRDKTGDLVDLTADSSLKAPPQKKANQTPQKLPPIKKGNKKLLKFPAQKKVNQTPQKLPPSKKGKKLSKGEIGNQMSQKASPGGKVNKMPQKVPTQQITNKTVQAVQKKYEEVTPANVHPLWVSLLKKYSMEEDPEYQLVCLDSGDTDAMDDWLRLILTDTGLVVCRKSTTGSKSEQSFFLAQIETLCRSRSVPLVSAPANVFNPFVEENLDKLGKKDASRVLVICLKKVRKADSHQLTGIQNIVLADVLRTRAVTPPALPTIIKAIRALDCAPPSVNTNLDSSDDGQSALVVGIDNVRELVTKGRPRLVLALRPKRIAKNPVVPILRDCVKKEIPFVLYRKAPFFTKFLEAQPGVIAACIIDGPPRYAQVIQALVDDLKKETLPEKNQRKNDESDARSTTVEQETLSKSKPMVEIQDDANVEEEAIDASTPNIPEKISVQEITSEVGSPSERSQSVTHTNEDASTVGLLESEVDVLRLEEKVYLFEAMLKNIADRRKLLQQEQDTAVADLREKEDRVVRLVAKKKELFLTLGRKRKLQQQMTKLLAKAEQRLQMLTTKDDISLADLVDLAGSESTASLNRDTDRTFSYSSSSSVQEARITSEQHRPGHTIHLAYIALDRLRTLWVSKRDPKFRLATFGSVLFTKEKIKTFLHINAMETLAVDKAANGWRWRRESMWNTCLDVRLIISDTWQNETRPTNFDRTADSSLKPVNDRVDPYIPICPYELSGECQDEYCAYQHLQPRTFGRVLPREFLPLPHLLLSLVEEVEDEIRLPEITSVQEKHRKGPAAKLPIPRADGKFEEDFILLPEVGLSSSDNANSGFEDYALLPVLEKYTIVNKADRTWLSRKQMEQTTKDNVSFKKLLQSGDFYLDEQQESIFVELERVKTPIEVFLFLVRLTKVVRLCIHAGRFDVSQAILDFASEWSEKLEKDRPSLGESTVEFSSAIVCIINTLEQKAFALETEPGDSVFQVAYRTQEHLAIICCLLEYVIPRIGDESILTVLRTLTALESVVAHIDQVDGDQPLDRLSIYFLPIGVQNDARQGVSLQEYLPQFIHHMRKTRQLRRDVITIRPPSKLVADVIKPSLRWFEQFVERSLRLGQHTKDVLLMGVMLISQLVMGTIEAVALELKMDSHIENVRNQMLDVWVAIDKLLFSIQKSCSFFPSLEFLLSPVLAANVALGTTLYAYDRVVVRLEKYLGGHVPSPLSVVSEILWSQLLQLEASLPKRADRIVALKGVYQLPLDVEELHELLALLITNYGVRPHHVVLANDWNLTSALIDEPSEETGVVFQGIHERLVEDNLPQMEFKMSDRKLVSQGSRGPCSGVSSPIPHSLLVIGTSINKLSLTRTGLKLLPDQFGIYFSSLEVRYKICCSLIVSTLTVYLFAAI
jgi:hypothetical protein